MAIVAERALAEADGDLATGRGVAAAFAAFGITSEAGRALLEQAPSRVRLSWWVAAAAQIYGSKLGYAGQIRRLDSGRGVEYRAETKHRARLNEIVRRLCARQAAAHA